MDLQSPLGSVDRSVEGVRAGASGLDNLGRIWVHYAFPQIKYLTRATRKIVQQVSIGAVEPYAQEDSLVRPMMGVMTDMLKNETSLLERFVKKNKGGKRTPLSIVSSPSIGSRQLSL